MFVKVHDHNKIDNKFIKIINGNELGEQFNICCDIRLDTLQSIENHLKTLYPDFELIDFSFPNASDGALELILTYADFYLLDKAYYDSPLSDGYGGKK